MPAAASGLTSPWVHHVDVSVFVKSAAGASTVARVGRELRASNLVEQVYFESRQQAYAEFQRLYSCWAAVSPSQTPASYRLVLLPAVTFGQRNRFVARVLKLPGVDTASCDPTLPCVNVIQSASARPSS